MIFLNLQNRNCYPLSFPILGGHNLTRALKSSPFQKYKNLEKSQKTTLRKEKKNWKKKKKIAKETCYYLSFPILGGRDLIRALQSTPFQNPGGG